MQTRSSQYTVLGKRPHQAEVKPAQAASPSESANSQSLLSPEITPKTKRARTSLPLLDGDSNKENVPPFCTKSFVDAPSSPSSARSLRRTSTEFVSPSRARRHASVSSGQGLPTTPATSMSALALSTPPPTPPVTLLPIHARARALLRSTCNGTSPIAGRTVERDMIAKFIASARESNCSDESLQPSLFISGTPGTGKTALVNYVLAGLEHCENLEVLTVNCMAFHNVDALWERLCESIGSTRSVKSTRKGKAKGRQLLDRLLVSQERRCLLVLDELDHIANSGHALSTVFSLARRYSSVLRIIAIANTHTLTTSANLSSDETTGVLTLHFGAYSSSQLLEVLQARLSPLYNVDDSPQSQQQVKSFLPNGSLTLLSKKVASQTGDVRTLLEVLRGAIDLAVSSFTTGAEENPLAAPVPAITPNHILSALKAYLPSNSTARCSPSTSACAFSSSSSEIATKVRNLGLQPRLALLAIVLASRRAEAALSLSSTSHSPIKTPTKRTSPSSNVGHLELSHLHSYYTTILDRSENGIFTPVSRSEFSDLIGVLETSGLVSSVSGSATISPSKSGRRGFGRSPSFGALGKGSAGGQDVKIVDSIRVEEVQRGLGLGITTETTDPREEEVRAIWMREDRRIARDIKVTLPSGQAQDRMLDGAFEG
ncbi:P-loop containing nucleoside triphosphate hydrolase protein [Melanogaster broomeanus]|nr:P-loop containing nucleoside triphosphate hydrolase protein [Melanogaster broomeanus]